MKIRPEIEVFDDPEFCEDTAKSCDFLIEESGVCRIYKNQILLEDHEYLEKKIIIYKKCDQCKADYQTALKKQPIRPEILFEGT